MANPTPPYDHRWRNHLWRTCVLAGPVVIARLGIIGLSAVDVAVLGRVGAEALGEYMLGLALFDSLAAATYGLVLGLSIVTARTMGEGRPEAVGAEWRRGVRYALTVGIMLCVVLQGAPYFYLMTGTDPDLAQRGGEVTAMIAFSLPGIAVYMACSAFLEALERPKIGMVVVGLANLSNLGLNMVLVFGWGPFPAMGAMGVALATAINSTLIALTLVIIIRWSLPGRETLGITKPASRPWRGAAEQRRLGYPAGASFLLEGGAFSAITIILAPLGAAALAGHSVLFPLIGVPFMLAFGIAAATQVRVSNAVGRRDRTGVVRAGWTGLALSSVVTGLLALVYGWMPQTPLRLFTTDPAVVAVALPAVIFAALSMVTDGGQTVMNSACRGQGDQWIPTSLHLISYWGLMVPLSFVLARPMGLGVVGIYQAIAVASVFSMLAMGLRFWVLSRRPIPPPSSSPH